MEDKLLQYGVLGVVVIGLVWYLLYREKQWRIEKKEEREAHRVDTEMHAKLHKEEREKLTDTQDRQLERMEEMSDEGNKIAREHIQILTGLKTLLENRIK